MKTFTFLALSSVVLGAALPDHIQTVLCTDAPTVTVTVTEKAGATAPADKSYKQGAGSYSAGSAPPKGTSSQYDAAPSFPPGQGTGELPSTASAPGETGQYTAAPSPPGGTGQYTAAPSPPGGSGQYTYTPPTSASSTASAPESVCTHHVDVGAFPRPDKSIQFQFRPNNISAEIGDVVLFNMLGESHSVTQSAFLRPCVKTGPFDTELTPNMGNVTGAFVKKFVVDKHTPLWFYCKQTKKVDHCGAGMVFGINPKSDQQMQQFISMAKFQNGTAAAGITGTATGTGISSYTSSAATAIPTVTVGLMNGTVLKFDPPFLGKLAVGSKVHFDFRAVNHTLTESTFGAPCTKKEGDVVDTDFENANPLDIAGKTGYDLTIEDGKPRWFYCKQTKKVSHCGAGMVFGLNTDAMKFSDFKKLAQKTAQ